MANKKLTPTIKTNTTITTAAGKPVLTPQYTLEMPALNSTQTKKVDPNIGKTSPYVAPLQTYPTTKKSTGSTGGGSTTSTLKTYLDQMINAYTQGAEANKATAKSTYDQTVADVNRAYDTTASNLLTSINRFREQNAQNVADQKKAYLSNQAALESARSEADRQTRIEAAAKGLGGSGLAQLAQLQNLINQSQDVSEVANENQSAMDTLRKALAQSEEDYNTNLTNAQTTRDTALSNALSNYNNTIQGIDADLADKIANASWDFGTTSASMSRGGGSSSGGDNYASSIGGLLTMTEKTLSDELENINSMTASQLKKSNYKTTNKEQASKQAYNNAKKAINGYIGDYGTDYNNLYNIGYSNLESIYNRYKKV